MSEPSPKPAPKVDDIQFDLEDRSVFERVAHVSIPAAVMERERVAAAQALAGKANLPGFRKGKVPASLIRKQYAAQVEQEALESVIPAAYRQLVESHEDLHPIAEPKVENLSMPEGEPIQFDLVVEVRPDVAIKGTSGLAVEKVVVPITEDRIDQALAELQERNASWDPVNRGAAEGDAMMIDYAPLQDDGTPDEENRNDSYSLLLGSDSVLPEFNSALQGLEAGEDTEVEVSYPEDYPKEELRGQTLKFQVSVKEVKAKLVPDLTDEFAAEKTSFDTLQELRDDVERELIRTTEVESGKHLRERIIDKLIEINDIPVPPSLEARYVQSMAADYERMMNQKMEPAQREQFQAQYAGTAQRAARRTIILDNIRRTEAIEASDEDVAAKIEELAQERDMTAEDFRRAVEGSGNLDRLKSDLEEEKIFDWLTDQAEVTVVEHQPDSDEAATDEPEANESKE